MKYKKSLTALSLVLLSLLASCQGDVTTSESSTSSSEITSSTEEDSTTSSSEEKTYALDFGEEGETWTKKTNAKTGVEYYTTSAVYCAHPTHPGNQSLDLYVSSAYFDESGNIDSTATVNGYTVDTAPIVYWNSHGSYIGLGPFGINGMSCRATQYGWALNMVKEGLVVCMVGERGKKTTDTEGHYIGKGLTAITDLKAGVRYLKHNDAVLPGDSDKIVSVGTSSGGAMSALLGVSGNCTYFNDKLEEMGACMDATDDVYATQAYCPITDLDHADFAYEWMFHEDNSSLTDFQKALSSAFVSEEVTYINSLGLTDEDGNALTLATDGSRSGTYYEWLKGKYEEAFEDYAENFDTDYKGYATLADSGAADADSLSWIDYDATTKEATLVTPEGYDSPLDAMILTGFRARQKTCPSFDNLKPKGTDNDIFGNPLSTSQEDEDYARHFNTRVAEIIASLKDTYPDEYEQYYQDYYDDSHLEEVQDVVKYINAYSYVKGEAEGTIAKHFRIAMGVSDADTTPLVDGTLALLLQNKGIDSTFKLLWGWGHNDTDTPTGLLDWIKGLED